MPGEAIQAAQVIYDIRSAPFSAWFGFAPLVLLSLAILADLVIRVRKSGPRLWKTGSPLNLVAQVFVLAITVDVIWAYRVERAVLIDSLETGAAHIVEGTMSGYQRQGWLGRPRGAFQVGGERFDFSIYTFAPGYQGHMAAGGQLRNGLHVRVSEFGGRIVRLEAIGGPY